MSEDHEQGRKKTGEEGRTAILEAMCFRLGEAVLCIPVDQVAEVLHEGHVTGLFHLPNWFIGVMSLRGEILELFDLASLLGRGPVRSPRFVLVVETALGRAGFPVQEVLGVRQVVPCGEGKPSEGNLPEWATGMGEMEGRSVAVLDMARFSLPSTDSGPADTPNRLGTVSARTGAAK